MINGRLTEDVRAPCRSEPEREESSTETEMNLGQVSHSPLLFPGTVLLSVLMSDHESGGFSPRGGPYGSPTSYYQDTDLTILSFWK